MKIKQPISSYEASASIKFLNSNYWIKGKVRLDYIFALVKIDLYEKNKHYSLIFDYQHDSNSDIYHGGLAIITIANSFHNQIISSVCALSDNAIGSNKYSELKHKFLISKEHNPFYSLRISNSIDKEYFNWLKETFKIQ